MCMLNIHLLPLQLHRQNNHLHLCHLLWLWLYLGSTAPLPSSHSSPWNVPPCMHLATTTPQLPSSSHQPADFVSISPSFQSDYSDTWKEKFELWRWEKALEKFSLRLPDTTLPFHLQPKPELTTINVLNPFEHVFQNKIKSSRNLLIFKQNPEFGLYSDTLHSWLPIELWQGVNSVFGQKMTWALREDLAICFPPYGRVGHWSTEHLSNQHSLPPPILELIHWLRPHHVL